MSHKYPSTLKKIEKRNLDPKERKINGVIAAREFRKRMITNGYCVVALWVPAAIREDVRAVMQDMVKEYEFKHPRARR